MMIDLLQIHEVLRPTDPDRGFGPDGAMAALLAAQKAGKIRFIGDGTAQHPWWLETAKPRG